MTWSKTSSFFKEPRGGGKNATDLGEVVAEEVATWAHWWSTAGSSRETTMAKKSGHHLAPLVIKMTCNKTSYTHSGVTSKGELFQTTTLNLDSSSRDKAFVVDVVVVVAVGRHVNEERAGENQK